MTSGPGAWDDPTTVSTWSTCALLGVAAWALAGPTFAQERLGAGLLELDTPSGFGRSMQGDVVVYRPVGPSRDCCALVIPPGEKTDQTLDAWFDARWNELAGNPASAEAPAPETDQTADGDARRTVGKGLPDGHGGQSIVFFTAIQRGSRVQALVFRGRPELGMESHLPAIDAALNGAHFRPRAEWPAPRVVPLSRLVSIAAGLSPVESRLDRTH